MSQLLVPISVGELLDKITILEIKSEKITDEDKLVNVRRELRELNDVRLMEIPESDGLDWLESELKRINLELWNIEDEIRECERAEDFGPRFVELARSVYRTNDQRAWVKREINAALGSELIEEKSYAAY